MIPVARGAVSMNSSNRCSLSPDVTEKHTAGMPIASGTLASALAALLEVVIPNVLRQHLPLEVD